VSSGVSQEDARLEVRSPLRAAFPAASGGTINSEEVQMHARHLQRALIRGSVVDAMKRGPSVGGGTSVNSLLVAGAILAFTTAGVDADTRTSQREMLAGLRAITLEMDASEPACVPPEVDVGQLRETGSALLRELGVPLANRAVQPNAPFVSLVLQSHCTQPWGRRAVTGVELHINWLTEVPNSPGTMRFTDVWLDSKFLETSLDHTVRELLRNFAIDYHAANGSGAAKRPSGHSK
jgi:hypothetical protein